MWVFVDTYPDNMLLLLHVNQTFCDLIFYMGINFSRGFLLAGL